MIKNKIENLIWIVFIGIGLIFLFVGILICGKNLNKEGKLETTGIITDIISYAGNDNEHTVYVEYKVDGKKYKSELNSYSSNYYEGKEIDIYYDEDNPKKIGTKMGDMLSILFPIFGLVFVVIGLVVMFKKIGKKNLKRTGEMVYANYIETILNRMYTVNGKHPYNVICEWDNPEDNKKYRLKSENLWINPENIIAEKNIKTFPVYFDIKNKKKYLIDTDCLTEDTVDLT